MHKAKPKRKFNKWLILPIIFFGTDCLLTGLYIIRYLIYIFLTGFDARLCEIAVGAFYIPLSFLLLGGCGLNFLPPVFLALIQRKPQAFKTLGYLVLWAGFFIGIGIFLVKDVTRPVIRDLNHGVVFGQFTIESASNNHHGPNTPESTTIVFEEFPDEKFDLVLPKLVKPGKAKVFLWPESKNVLEIIQ